MSPRLIDRQRSWWRRSSRRASASNALDRAIAPLIEGLERRTMMAYTDTSNAPKFKLIGDDIDENIQVIWQGGNDWQFAVNGNPVGGIFDTGYWQIEIYGNGGDDTIDGSGTLNIDTFGVHDLIDGGPGD